jgi:subtilisin family serine protease
MRSLVAIWLLSIALLQAQIRPQAEAALYSDDAIRGEAARRLAEAEKTSRAAAAAEARRRGMSERIILPDGRIQEIVGLRDGRLLYRTTQNANAAISAAANTARTAFSLDGSGVRVGVWDGGAVRTSHVEFGGRVTLRNNVSIIDHATHVAGTIGASGQRASARGMAPSVLIDSYDWNGDLAEMTSAAAATPNQAGRIPLSNHSYGFISGWNFVNSGSPNRIWEWWGSGTTQTAVEPYFGAYNEYPQNLDTLAHNAPYYLIFWSAGNDRNNTPSYGQSVALSPGSSTVVSYDSSIHPPGDGSYRGGFDTISFHGLAKNIMTVGAVNDAVSSGNRSLAAASMSDFSSWGPTDDGRIKPDIVANGVTLESASGQANDRYLSMSGTSMSSPSACGAAALLVQQYANLFPGQAMRAATLKGLLIHTADDLGNTGPDYRNGWGHINTLTAANLLHARANQPDTPRLFERTLSRSQTLSIPFNWDGLSAIHATLSWTDPPPATAINNPHDTRTPVLVHDLDLRIQAPDGTWRDPFVMPFVGTWSQASMNATAVTGTNRTDNVEQVRIPSPTLPGTYRAVISHAGSLAAGGQAFSLLISGATTTMEITSISPDRSPQNTSRLLEIQGFDLDPAGTLKLTAPGTPDIPLPILSSDHTLLLATLAPGSAPVGPRTLIYTHPNGTIIELENAVEITRPVFTRDFDSPYSGWTNFRESGTAGNWLESTSTPHSPPHCWFVAGPSSRSLINLTSESISIPATVSDLWLEFHHSHNLQTNLDAGVLELSTDNGATWLDAGSEASGTRFLQGGYNGIISNSGLFASSRNLLAARPGWSGNSNGYTLVRLALEDNSRYSGANLHLRWRLSTNGSTASPDGWRIDSVLLHGTPDFYQEWINSTFTQNQILSGDSNPSADPDGDGISNQNEFLLGLDPNDDRSRLILSASPADPGQLAFTLNRAIPLGTFQIEYTPDLTTPWTIHEILSIPAETTDFQITLPEAGERGFYRLRFLPPP